MKFRTTDGGDLGTICIPDEVDPQEYAMMAAWFSRSTESVETMVDKVSKEGSTSFMARYYVGYGHESIGDLVDVKLFIHGIPLYLAPLIEHYALFRGQESSTRYIDFSTQRLYGPEQDLMKAQVDEYFRALEHVTDRLVSINEPKDAIQFNAVKARAFDICRGLLPLGATTNVAWFGDIRSMKGHLAWMRDAYPWSLPWVDHIYGALREAYPDSCERELKDVRGRLPWVFDKTGGTDVLTGSIDFGSWRDLNRHRVGRHTFTLPSRVARIESWYLERFGELGFELDHHLAERRKAQGQDRGSLLLGQTVPFRYEMPASQAAYLAWRRSQMDVHPTLRLRVQEWAQVVGLRDEPIEPDVGTGYVERRGGQTIFHRP